MILPRHAGTGTREKTVLNNRSLAAGSCRTGYRCKLAALIAAAMAAPTLGVTYNITDYGAISGDGVSDLVAIQNAIGAASPGDSVRLPAGNWSIDGTIHAAPGVAILGDGRDASTITRLPTGGAAEMLRLEDISNVRVSGFTLDGANTTVATQGMVMVNGGQHIVDGVRVTNLVGDSSVAFGPHGIYAAANVDDTTVSNSEFTNLGIGSDWGGGVRFSGGSDRATLVNNIIDQTGRGGILLDGSGQAIIRGNTITGSGRAYDGRRVIDDQTKGIELFQAGDGSVIENNTLDHWLSIDQSSRVAVRNNTLLGDGRISYLGLELANASQDVIFSGNTVEGGAHTGIELSNEGVRDRILIAGNTVNDASVWGAQIQPGNNDANSRVVLAENIITRTSDGTGVFGSPASPGDRGAAVRINTDNGNLTSFALLNNTLHQNAGQGVQLIDDPADAEMLNRFFAVSNTITSNAGRGVDPLNPGTTGTWAANLVANNADDTQPALADDTLPLLNIIAPPVVSAGQRVTLTAEMTGGMIDAVLWDVGIGAPLTDASLSVIYDTPGMYTLWVAAWTADGRPGVASMTLNVVPEPAAISLLAIPMLLRRRVRL